MQLDKPTDEKATHETNVHHFHHFALSALEFLLTEYRDGRHPQDRDVVSAQTYLTELGAHRVALTVTPEVNQDLAGADKEVAEAQAHVAEVKTHRERVDKSIKIGVRVEDLDKADADVKAAQVKMNEAQEKFDRATRDDVPLEEREAAQKEIGKAKEELLAAEAHQANPSADVPHTVDPIDHHRFADDGAPEGAWGPYGGEPAATDQPVL